MLIISPIVLLDKSYYLRYQKCFRIILVYLTCIYLVDFSHKKYGLLKATASAVRRFRSVCVLRTCQSRTAITWAVCNALASLRSRQHNNRLTINCVWEHVYSHTFFHSVACSFHYFKISHK